MSCSTALIVLPASSFGQSMSWLYNWSWSLHSFGDSGKRTFKASPYFLFFDCWYSSWAFYLLLCAYAELASRCPSVLNVIPISIPVLGKDLRRPESAPVRRCEILNLGEIRRGRGRPKKTWLEVIRNDLNLLNLTEDMTSDRDHWRRSIRAADV